ncbi:MAG: hypothetical protein ACWA6X_14365 [Bauldia sp.]|jgi:hypothetical protein
MAKIIPFPVRSKDEDADPEIDLMTAVDVAIRDLRDIAARLDHPGREQADSCRKMLERSLDAARLGAW